MSISSSSRVLVLRSSDGETFNVEENVAVKSETIKNIVDAACSESIIPIPNVTASVLRKVIQYCKKHVDVGAMGDDLKDWDKNFVDVDEATLYHLISAAHYLDIKDLLDLLCQTVADIIKGKKVEEIREIFNITNDFAPEEEAELRRDNQWAFE